MKKTTNTWGYKIAIYAIIANFVCVRVNMSNNPADWRYPVQGVVDPPLFIFTVVDPVAMNLGQILRKIYALTQ